MNHVEFNYDYEPTVREIVQRWSILLASRIDTPMPDPQDVEMDLMAANGVNGNPELDLDKLLAFDEFNFAHDMAGISRHMNRETGKIEGCFLPRCAVPENHHA